MSAIPGWYPDPAGAPDLRYWNGEVWTAATTPPAPAAVATAPHAAPLPAAPPGSSFQPTAPSRARPPEPPGRIPTPRGEYALSLPQRVDLPSERKTSISGWMVAAIVAALAVTAGAVYFLNQHHGSAVRVSAHTTIDMPAEVDGLVRIHSPASDELQRIMSSSSVPKPHLVGFYGTNPDNPGAFMMVAKYPQTADQVAHNLSLSLRALDESIGNVNFFQPADPGPLGGQMRCATVVQNATSASVCMFEDTDVIGVTFSVGTASAPGPDAVTLRNAVEKRN